MDNVRDCAFVGTVNKAVVSEVNISNASSVLTFSLKTKVLNSKLSKYLIEDITIHFKS